MITEFTPIASTIGGALIGLASVALMLTHGRIAGVSGIAVRMFPPYLDKESIGRVAFIIGLVGAPLLYAKVTGSWASMDISGGPVVLIAAGLLAGFGAVWGNGCTSGHGICGLSRLSKRSFIAVCVFMFTAVVTVFVTRHLL
jgi:uncharacterized membrane protein YedE/YeeE